MNQELTESDLFNVHPSHQPKWPEWRAKHHAPISHLVFLSINICPVTALGLFPHENVPGSERLHDEHFYPEYFTRLDAILSHVKGKSEWFHPVQVDEESPEKSTISFDEFVKFANSHAWPLPENFPGQLIQTRLDANRTHRWPWGEYTTERLEILAEAVKLFWRNYDPSEPDTAPGATQVDDFLKKKGIFSKSARQEMRAIMRSGNAPKGRPKKSEY